MLKMLKEESESEEDGFFGVLCLSLYTNCITMAS